MRLVKYEANNLPVSQEWRNKAIALKNALIAENDPLKRSEIIEKNSSLWSEVKPELAKLFNYKCWYTESIQKGTDVDVDHYRPKNRVAELRKNNPQHLGYWWLAFELTNYRYSCIVANRRRTDIVTNATGGKADHFPVWDEKDRVWDHLGNIEDEQPMLLDPCKSSDVRLLTFKEDGEAMPREKETEKPRLYKRAELSIEFYNLNHRDFVRERIKLRDKINTLTKNAKRFYEKLESGDAAHTDAYEQTLLELKHLVDVNSEFSSFCLAYLENFKHEDYLTGILY